jgi:hypothetical protein
MPGLTRSHLERSIQLRRQRADGVPFDPDAHTAKQRDAVNGQKVIVKVSSANDLPSEHQAQGTEVRIRHVLVAKHCYQPQATVLCGARGSGLDAHNIITTYISWPCCAHVFNVQCRAHQHAATIKKLGRGQAKYCPISV